MVAFIIIQTVAHLVDERIQRKVGCVLAAAMTAVALAVESIRLRLRSIDMKVFDEVKSWMHHTIICSRSFLCRQVAADSPAHGSDCP